MAKLTKQEKRDRRERRERRKARAAKQSALGPACKVCNDTGSVNVDPAGVMSRPCSCKAGESIKENLKQFVA